MARRLIADEGAVRAHPHRYRLHRAGVLNVWQYDEQVFDFADGRLLLRGANGAGKSKTLEMLLPFVLDGDKLHLTASGRHHTSLLWLMLDGVDGGTRTGYLWVEFARTADDGRREVLTCGVGVRASRSARVAQSWFFTCPGAVGDDLRLEDASGPISRERCREAVGPDGHFFDTPRQYKEHVGRLLFGLDLSRYDELLRLLYWLRQPQVGEDIEPGRLADILAVALPELDEAAVRSVGDSLDQLAEFGEQLERRARAAAAVAEFATTYSHYAGGVARARGAAVLGAERERARRARELAEKAREHERVHADAESTTAELTAASGREQEASAGIRQLEASPEARSQQVLLEKERRARDLAGLAEQSRRRAAGDAQRIQAAATRRQSDTEQLLAEVADVRDRAGAGSAELARCGVGAALPLPSALGEPRLADPGDGGAVAAGAAELAAAVAAARPAVGSALAAVQVVRAALTTAEQAELARRSAEERAAEAEHREEGAAARAADARSVAAVAEADHGQRLTAWAGDAGGVPVELPTPLTPEGIDGLPARARAAAAPVLATARGAETDAATRRQAAEQRLTGLRRLRVEIDAERDPAPAPPPLPRPARDPATGLPLWRLVDVGDGSLDDAARAAVEAALEASGLLDAQVRADGSVLAADEFDTVLPLGPAVDGPSLADLLVPAMPEDSPVPERVVGRVLGAVALADAVTLDGPPAQIGRDGSWRLGVLTGRAAKPVAQYVGASARAAERVRRLAAVDAEIAQVTGERDHAAEDQRAAAGRRAAVEGWLAALPDPSAVREAWTRLRVVTEEWDRLAAEAERLRGTAAAAREQAATRRRELESLAAEHGLPADATGLDARREALRAVEHRLAELAVAARRLRPPLERWESDLGAWLADRADADRSRQAAEEAADLARQAAAEHEALRETLGADVLALEAALREARDARRHASSAAEAARRRLARLTEQRGAARAAVDAAGERLAEAVPEVASSAAALGTLGDVPGLLDAALGRPLDPGEVAGLDAGRACDGERLPRQVADLARMLAALPEDGRPVVDNDVYAEWRTLSSGPAADTEPRVIPLAGALAVLARDESGERPVAAVAAGLAARVAADRELLTTRERALFEEHLLGELGDRLRGRRQEAVELVAAMNRLLDGVRTSQGIAVRLDWDLRDDVEPEVRDAVGLLGRPLGALLPDERTRLRDALHRLIEASRAEDPAVGYAEHLGRALDYRRWSAFRVRISRPESPQWAVLTRRTPLSQGEQKVVCYLPLFAAAAAHFTSVAGAAPHAPRLVLLDDAFPKIDVRTHPLLFGLLVQLDLDFVVTSERLWGDYPTVPSLAIYEALRSPTERGIAQYEHRWDGQRLTRVPA